MVNKTRDRLIEVARQLFARKGVENTTMNDIAEASDKGRRTIYTYFRNKRDIYRAVIEKESEHLTSRLRDICHSPLEPRQKLHAFLLEEIKVAHEAANDNGWGWISFTLDITGREEKVRRLARAKEVEMCRQILDEGIQAGQFDPEQCRLLLDLGAMMLRGAYHLYKETRLMKEMTTQATPDVIAAFFTDAVLARGNNNQS